jgi:hypothetical protein
MNRAQMILEQNGGSSGLDLLSSFREAVGDGGVADDLLGLAKKFF